MTSRRSTHPVLFPLTPTENEDQDDYTTETDLYSLGACLFSAADFGLGEDDIPELDGKF